MRPLLLAPVVLAAVSSVPNFAFAQESAAPDGCPSGDWFCSTGDSAPTESAQTEAAQTEAAPTIDPSAPESSRTPPVVIIIVPGATAEPAPVYRFKFPMHRHRPHGRRVVAPKAAPQKASTPQEAPRPAPTKQSDEPKSGFDIHVQNLSFFDGQTVGSAAPDAGLMGVGATLRIPARKDLEIHVGNSGLVGKDFNGFERGEVGFALYAQRHLNPDSRLRFYGLAGGVVAFGHATSKQASPLLPAESATGEFYANYGLLSGQFGLGAELRLVSFLSVHVDALASMRWRFSATNDAPEYIDRVTGSPVYAYPGLMLRGGATFW